MKKRFIYFAAPLLIIVGLFGLFYLVKFYLSYQDAINYLLAGGKSYEHQVFQSPNGKNKITVLVHLYGMVDYESNIYIIDGVYNKNKIPNENYVRFPNGAGIYIDWQTEETCKVLADLSPEIDKLHPRSYELKLQIDRKKIRHLAQKAKVIRFSIKERVAEDYN